MKYLIIAAFMAAPAAADTLTAENCVFAFEDRTSAISCEFTNHAAQAVASFAYAVTITQEGRDVPWLKTDRSGQWPISGGLEPGEKLKLTVMSMGVPDRADRDALQIVITPYDAKNAAGELID